ncbi:MAG TPA: methyltransferase domain-containing protein [Syntrophobacteraceae bacterium]|nr:methyltransferase domain-containing protein [Syntrophobacteraceae bacterium]
MEDCLSSRQRDQIHASIRRKYRGVAENPGGSFRYPTGLAGLQALGYPSQLLDGLPAKVPDFYCGVGNPFSLGNLSTGAFVLDIGCGAGVDSILAARWVGPQGRVLGVDLTFEMLFRARQNRRRSTGENVLFAQASAEALPLPAAAFDVVISNGTFNLVPDKRAALGEVYRVIKPGGRFWVADQVLLGNPPEDLAARIARWAR